MSPPSAADTSGFTSGFPRATYEARLATAHDTKKGLDRQGAVLANLRMVTFSAAGVLFLLAVFDKFVPPVLGYWGALACFVGYIVLAWRHHHVIKAEARADVRVKLNERALARGEGKWHAFEERGDAFADPAHLYTPDLDIFGQGSLFQLLDETATKAGEARLASYLTAPALPAVVRARQGAVKELGPRVEFRQELIVESRLAAKEKADPSRFLAWAEGASTLEKVRWARPLTLVLPLVTLTLYLLGRFEVIPSVAVWAGVLLQLGVVLLTRNAVADVYGRIVLGERGFVRFEETFRRVEAEPLTDAHLRSVLGPLNVPAGSAEAPVSARLRKFSRLFAFAELRQSTQMHALINLLTLWDLQFLFRLDDWRKDQGPSARAWFEALAELEALGALANYHFEHPTHPFPDVTEGPAMLEARALVHPLLARAVPNDVSLSKPSAGYILTGSNMSGKTTLLRAMGVNTVLAQAGAPVAAASMTLSTLHVLTSMRVKDSLERGVSYFYAEVQRIKAVLDGAQAVGGKALFLLDEILLGTNTRERQIASREILLGLWRSGAIGGVATHDLALASLDSASGLFVANVHFEDQLVDGNMTFDYRMREGVVQGTNALRVLASAGIPLTSTEP